MSVYAYMIERKTKQPSLLFSFILSLSPFCLFPIHLSTHHYPNFLCTNTHDARESRAVCVARWTPPRGIFEGAQDPLWKHVRVFEDSSVPRSTCKFTNHSPVCGFLDPACSLRGEKLPWQGCFPLFFLTAAFFWNPGSKGWHWSSLSPGCPDAGAGGTWMLRLLSTGAPLLSLEGGPGRAQEPLREAPLKGLRAEKEAEARPLRSQAQWDRGCRLPILHHDVGRPKLKCYPREGG